MGEMYTPRQAEMMNEPVTHREDETVAALLQRTRVTHDEVMNLLDSIIGSICGGVPGANPTKESGCMMDDAKAVLEQSKMIYEMTAKLRMVLLG